MVILVTMISNSIALWSDLNKNCGYSTSASPNVAISVLMIQACLSKGDVTRNQINDTFLFQNRVKVKVVWEVSEK